MNTYENREAERWENEDFDRFVKLAEEAGFGVEIEPCGVTLIDELGETYFYADWHEAWNVLREEERDAIQAQIEVIDAKIWA